MCMSTFLCHLVQPEEIYFYWCGTGGGGQILQKKDFLESKFHGINPITEKL